MSRFIELFEHSLVKNAARNALFYEAEAYTYLQLADEINRLANGFIEMGVKPSDRVVILLPNFTQFPVAFFAAIKIGAIAVPLNFLNNDALINRQLELIQPSVIVLWEGVLTKVGSYLNIHQTEHVVIGATPPKTGHGWVQLLSQNPPLESAPEIPEEASAAIVFTGGGSGDPKAVDLSHHALLTNSMGVRKTFLINYQDIFVAALPLFLFISQTALLITALISGAQIVLCPSFDIEQIAQWIEARKATFIIGSAAMYDAFCESSVKAVMLASLRHCVTAGEITDTSLFSKFSERFDLSLLESYSLPEAAGIVSIGLSPNDTHQTAAGVPLNGTLIRIQDGGYRSTENEKLGEICVQSACLMKGYWNNPAETEKCLSDGWFFTGDLGFLDSYDRLHVLGRKQDVIINGGFLIFPKRIEAVLLNHPGIKEVAVVGVKEGRLGQEIKACIVLEAGQQLTRDAILGYCQQYLPIYQQPKYVQIYQTLPKSPTGRVSRYQLIA